MSVLFLVYIVVFLFIFFFLTEDKLFHLTKEEEQEVIHVTEISGDEGNIQDFKKSVKICFKKPAIREWVILYMIFNGVYRTVVLLGTLFLENRNFGFNISPSTMSNLQLFTMIPNMILMFSAPYFVNNFFNDRIFLKAVVFLHVMGTLMIPIYKELQTRFASTNFFYLVMLNQILIMCMSPGIINPYFYYYIIKRTPQKYRTNVNSSIFLSNQILNMITLLVGGFIYSSTVSTQAF